MLKISKKGRKSIPYDENQNSSMTQFQRQIFIFYLQNEYTNGNIYNRGAVHEAAWWSNRKNQTRTEPRQRLANQPHGPDPHDGQ